MTSQPKPPTSSAPPPGNPAVFSPARILQSAVSTVTQARASSLGKPAARSASGQAMDSGPWSPPTPSRMADDDERFHTADDLIQAYKNLEDAVTGHNLTSVLSAPGGSYSTGSSSGPSLSRIFALGGAAVAAPLPSASHDAEDKTAPKPPVASIIPHVTFADFKNSLERTRARTERFLARSSDVPRAGIKQPSSRAILARQASSSANKVEEDPALQLARCYASIPSAFFDAPFDPIRDDDQVLRLVNATQRRMSDPDAEDGPAEAGRVREEMEARLSDNLNLVEQCLFAQTTSKADTIFTTVSNLHLLQSMVQQESSRVAKLRGHMATLRSVATEGRGQVLALQRRRANSSALQKTLDAVKRVATVKTALDKLLNSQDYTGAFAAIESMQQILDGELAGVHALRTLVRQLRDMKDVIGSEMVDKFVRLASDQTESELDDGKLKHALAPLVRGLYRKGDLRDALSKYRTKLVDLTKSISKTVVNEYVPEGGDRILHLEPAKFVAFLKAMCDELQHLLDRAELVNSAVKLSLQTGGQTAKMTPQEREEIKEIINASAGVVLKARDNTHKIVKNFLEFRKEEHVKLRLADFKLIWDTTTDFIASSGEPAMELKSVLQTQAHDFLLGMDERLGGQLASAFEAETWDAVAVPREFQILVDRIEANNILGPADELELQQPPRKCITVEGRELRCLNVTLMMIKYLVEYLKCAILFPAVGAVAAQKLFDVCVVYDATTKRLILGAQARRQDRLKSIGSRHLAVAAQSLKVVCLLLPCIGRIIMEVVPPQQVSRVDEERMRVQESYSQHINQLNDTMASLIGGELSKLQEPMMQIDWDARGASGLDSAQEYMVKLCEQIKRLHSVLSNHLPPEDVNDVFDKVCETCNQRVPELFQNINPRTIIGRARVRTDVAHLLHTLRSLPRTNGPGESLEQWLDQRFGRPPDSAAEQ